MENKSLAIQGGDITAIRISREDITTHFCPKATDKEVAMALAIVKSLHLNPFTREVYFIKYSEKDKMQIVVGYEVYLKRAERSGKLNGWKAGINTKENFAWVKIWRKDWQEPFEWSVNLDEFNKKQSTWNQIPSFMGRKVAIAQGFRLCFPDETGGLPYTQEEHEVYDIDLKDVTVGKPAVAAPKSKSEKEQAESEPPKAKSQSNGDLITAPQGKRFYAIARGSGMTDEDIKPWLMKEYGIESSRDIKISQYEGVCEALAIWNK